MDNLKGKRKATDDPNIDEIKKSFAESTNGNNNHDDRTRNENEEQNIENQSDDGENEEYDSEDSEDENDFGNESENETIDETSNHNISESVTSESLRRQTSNENDLNFSEYDIIDDDDDKEKVADEGITITGEIKSKHKKGKNTNTVIIKKSTNKKSRKSKTGVDGGEKQKKKQKRRNPNMRKNIRDTFANKQLDTMTQQLREKEQERLKRLGLLPQTILSSDNLEEIKTAGSTTCMTSTVTSSTKASLNTTESQISKSLVTLKETSKSQDNEKATVEKAVSDVICLDSSSDDDRDTLIDATKNKPAPIETSPGKKHEVLVLSSDSDSDSGGVSSDEEGISDHHSQLGLHTNDAFNKIDSNGKVLVNLQRNKYSDSCLYLTKRMSSLLKPHQIGGIRFLYDNLIESASNFNANLGNGCILAHSMGLGKTIQTVTFIDLCLRETTAKKVLCVVPVNTIQNWASEFNRWVPPRPEPSPPQTQTFGEGNLTTATSKKNYKKTVRNNKNKKFKSISHHKIPSEVTSYHDFPIIQEIVDDIVDSVELRVTYDEVMVNTRSHLVHQQQQQQYQSQLPLQHHSQQQRPPSNTDYFKLQSQIGSNLNEGKLLVPENKNIEDGESNEINTSLAKQPQNRTISYGQSIKIEESPQDSKIQSCTTYNIGYLQCDGTTPGNSSDKVTRNETSQPDTLQANTEKDSDEIKEEDYRSYKVFLIDTQKGWPERIQIMDEWHTDGGVLLIGYEMYRAVASGLKIHKLKGKKSRMLQEEKRDISKAMREAICDPGPDLVVCDEGHRIRNYQSGISQALKNIATKKRLVLTGYPIQNNLVEYWCMVDFVRPNYLGSRQEFANMFERPILNGQCVDSTPSDKHIMRQKAHVLYSLLQGFVQRRDHSVFKSILPEKEENVIMVRLSPLQRALYERLIELTKEAYNDSLNPIKTFHLCCKIWNHPDILYKALYTCEQGKLLDIFNDEDDIPLDSDTKQQKRKKPSVPSTQQSSQQDPPPCGPNWPPQEPKEILMDISQWAPSIFSKFPYVPGDLHNSGKFDILNKLIDESVASGDKMLVFSQSLLTLNHMEEMLQLKRLCSESTDVWKKGVHYFRLDGSTTSVERERYIKLFNDPKNADIRLFLLSTRAGCLGINLVGANRVVVFDVSWNPCHDAQAVCRIYRYGQTKPCHIYRLVASNTMEKKMYYRQISKQGISNRVVDELNQTENFSKNEIQSLIIEEWVDEPPVDLSAFLSKQTDNVLKNVLGTSTEWCAKVPFKHESLLVNVNESEFLTGSEKRAAKRAYEAEKKTGYSGSRLYPLQPSFPKNTPVVSVKPFSWRPPSLAISTLSNNLSFPVMVSSSSNGLVTSQYDCMLSRIGSQMTANPVPSSGDTFSMKRLQVNIEIGHQAIAKENLVNIFTHDWTVYVRGVDNSDISQFIEKVEFNLHGTFYNPKRVCMEPPYKISEQGYGSFTLPIDIYFRNVEEPRKYSVNYELSLQLRGLPPLNATKVMALTFHNPSDEFKKKLISGGAVVLTQGITRPTFSQLLDVNTKLSNSTLSTSIAYTPNFSGSNDVRSLMLSTARNNLTAANVITPAQGVVSTQVSTSPTNYAHLSLALDTLISRPISQPTLDALVPVSGSFSDTYSTPSIFSSGPFQTASYRTSVSTSITPTSDRQLLSHNSTSRETNTSFPNSVTSATDLFNQKLPNYTVQSGNEQYNPSDNNLNAILQSTNHQMNFMPNFFGFFGAPPNLQVPLPQQRLNYLLSKQSTAQTQNVQQPCSTSNIIVLDDSEDEDQQQS